MVNMTLETVSAENYPLYTKIKMQYSKMGLAEKKAADYMLKHQDKMLTLTVNELAKTIGISEATIMRFCRRFGMSGYVEFKLLVAKSIGEKESPGDEKKLIDIVITQDDHLNDLPEKIISNTINGLRDTGISLNRNELERAVKAIQAARQIMVFGVANSAIVSDDIAHKLSRLGMICNSYSDPHRQLIAGTHLSSLDVAIGVSHSGFTKDTVETITMAKKCGATTICISNQFASPIIDVSDICLLTAAHEVSFTSETMVSRISQLAIVDMLYCGIILQDYEYYSRQISRSNQSTNGKAYHS
jgi:DNA-binding MurR/RpiR family transcriptional regulator